MNQANKHASCRKPGCLRVWEYVKLWIFVLYSGCTLRPVAYSAPVHTASRQTQSLHPKNLSSYVSLVRVESQLLSNRVSRRARGWRGGFWVLKQFKKGEKSSFVGQQPWCKETVVVWHRSGGGETITSWKTSVFRFEGQESFMDYLAAAAKNGDACVHVILCND